MTTLGIGIDLSGYGTGRTACAAARLHASSIEVVILANHPLAARHTGEEPLAPVLAAEIRFIKALIKIGPVAVDIPIDLQGLPQPRSPESIWQLTKRPIDRALHALPPLADKIGSPVARFQRIARQAKLMDLLGISLFETYPGGICRRLGVSREDFVDRRRLVLTEDEMDAAICALAAIPSLQLKEQDLADATDVGVDDLPRGYTLLKEKPPRKATVSRQDANV